MIDNSLLTGESFSTVVNILTVATVTRSKNAVSTKEHFWTGWQCNIETPSGSSKAALAQSTAPWWNSKPCDHLKQQETRFIFDEL